MKWTLLLSFTWGLTLAAQEPPRCVQSLRGTLWPAEANTSQEARRQALKCGELRMCTRGLWRYHWEAVGVAYWRLAGEAAPEGCEAGVAEAAKKGTGPVTD